MASIILNLKTGNEMKSKHTVCLQKFGRIDKIHFFLLVEIEMYSSEN